MDREVYSIEGSGEESIRQPDEGRRVPPPARHQIRGATPVIASLQLFSRPLLLLLLLLCR